MHEDTKPAAVPRLGFDQVELLVAGVLRAPELFTQARSLLDARYFSHDYEITYATIWRACLALHAQYGRLPTQAMLETEVMAAIEAEPNLVGPELGESVRKFLAWAYLEPLDKQPPRHLHKLLESFLQERSVVDPLRDFLSSLSTFNPANVPELLRKHMAQATRVAASQRCRVEDLIPTTDPAPLLRLKTGVDFMDNFLGGGRGRTEAYALVGPSGAGKTTLLNQLAVRGVEQEVNRAAKTGQPARHSYFFTWETPAAKVRQLALACAATIDKDRLAKLTSWRDFSGFSTRASQATLQPYELDNQKELTADKVLGELERAQGVLPWLGKLWHVIDMRGSPDDPMAGGGFIDEVANILQGERQAGRFIDQVFFDYAQLICYRHIYANGWQEADKLRHLMSRLGHDCGRVIADPFDCTVWITAQPKGEVSRGASTRLPRANEIAECSGFMNNLWYVFMMGCKDEQTGCVLFKPDKTRDTEGNEPPVVLKIRPYGRLDLMDDRYAPDSRTKKIVARSDMARAYEKVPRHHAPADADARSDVEFDDR